MHELKDDQPNLLLYAAHSRLMRVCSETSVVGHKSEKKIIATPPTRPHTKWYTVPVPFDFVKTPCSYHTVYRYLNIVSINRSIGPPPVVHRLGGLLLG
jgi:hypothetical protein